MCCNQSNHTLRVNTVSFLRASKQGHLGSIAALGWSGGREQGRGAGRSISYDTGVLQIVHFISVK